MKYLTRLIQRVDSMDNLDPNFCSNRNNNKPTLLEWLTPVLNLLLVIGIGVSLGIVVEAIRMIRKGLRLW